MTEDKFHVLRKIAHEKKLLQDMSQAEEANERANELIMHLIKELFSSKEQYSQYGLSLDQFSKQIQSDKGIEGIRGFLSSLLDETVQIQQTNTNLSQKLDHSSKELNEMKQQLEVAIKEAVIDKLTQLYNRRAFERNIREEADRFFRYKNPFSLIILDVDDFKNLNDSYGHQIGDRALIGIARQLKSNVRKTDSVYRFGGEEFAVILPNTQIPQAGLAAEKIRVSVQETAFTRHKVDVGITLSGGISQIREGDTLEEFILRADKALYLAKQKGKNQIKTQFDLPESDSHLFP